MSGTTTIWSHEMVGEACVTNIWIGENSDDIELDGMFSGTTRGYFVEYPSSDSNWLMPLELKP